MEAETKNFQDEAIAKIAERLEYLVQLAISDDLGKGIPQDYGKIVRTLIEEKLISLSPELNREVINKSVKHAWKELDSSLAKMTERLRDVFK